MSELESIDWASFDGPKLYKPSDVPSSLRAMVNAATEEEARNAYNRVLFAIGNNHAGTIYPAAAAAVPFILEIALRPEIWPRWSALEVLVELLSFDVEPGYESAQLDGRMEPLKKVIKGVVRSRHKDLETLAKSEAKHSKVQQSAAQVLVALSAD